MRLSSIFCLGFFAASLLALVSCTQVDDSRPIGTAVTHLSPAPAAPPKPVTPPTAKEENKSDDTAVDKEAAKTEKVEKAAKTPANPKPRVELTTSVGKIVLELDAVKAPGTVANFLQYVKEGHYAGTIFHRVIKSFMIQGGGFDEKYQEKPTRAPIQNEADNGLSNLRGSIAMARTPNPHSASAQFFINVVDNPNLNFRSKTPPGWGYCVFGKVIKGMDVVDKIKEATTGPGGPFPTDAPQTLIVIKSAKVVK